MEMRLFERRADAYERYVPGKVCLEIGVFAGDNARQIWKHGPAELYALDTFEGMAQSGDEDGENRRSVHLPRVYYQLQRDVPEMRLIRGRSPKALVHVQHALEFVYIDGDHRYEGVKADLKAVLPLCAPGAVIAGHDYCKRTPGVMQAVQEFCAEHGKEIVAMTTGPIPSYFIQL
jgi:hypothetical protein